MVRLIGQPETRNPKLATRNPVPPQLGGSKPATLLNRLLALVGLTTITPGTSNVVTDNAPGWDLLAGGTGPQDRAWYDLAQDMDDALEAWRKNFLIRQIVRLTTAYVVGDGITVKANHHHVARFAADFWNHRQNRIDRRLSAWCDELTRAGELFLALFTNPVDGMSYVRAIPARSIIKVVTDPDDYERETAYHERQQGSVEPKVWASAVSAGPTEPVLLHYAINRPVGATRGESDLTPILPWARRYTEWLKDRVRFNRIRTEMAAAWIQVQDDSQVEKKRRLYAANPPTGGNIFVTGPGESLSFPAARIDAGDAEPDGKAIRLAVAAGADVPLHYLAEGSAATRSTAAEMGDPTRRHYRLRQIDFAYFLTDLVEKAYIRRAQVLGIRQFTDPQLVADMPDVSREDNESLARAADTIVQAFATMRQYSWIDDETAIRLSFKFAGEVLDEDHIQRILDTASSPSGEHPGS